jgi:hypothetical protein
MANTTENTWVFFENALLAASVQYEVDALSRGGLEATLTQIKRLYEGEIDPDGLPIWHEYQGIPLFLFEYHGELMVYAIESEFDDEQRMLKISIMFAGVRRVGYFGPDVVWDGTDESLWRDVVEPRCRYQFV